LDDIRKKIGLDITSIRKHIAKLLRVEIKKSNWVDVGIYR